MRKYLLTPIVFLLVLFFFFEIGSCVLVRTDLMPRDLPNYSWKYMDSDFWVINNPHVGRWHGPNASYRHKRTCFEVLYQANEFGMRDRSRELISDQPRAVLLGDSFVEGYGLSEEDRISNRLEQYRGMEHLNFGSSGFFGPTEYLLIYKNLAKQFTHSEVIVFVYPDNDFADDDYGLWTGTRHYQPFLVGQYPDYRLVYPKPSLPDNKASLGKTLKRFFREFTHSYGVVGGLYKILFPSNQKIMNTPDGEIFSGFYDFNEEGWNRMKYALEQISREAQGKKVSVVLIPAPHDLERYAKSGESPLFQKMQQLSKTSGMTVINLLPHLGEHNHSLEDYYLLPCDHHFSPKGAQIVAKKIQDSLP